MPKVINISAFNSLIISKYYLIHINIYLIDSCSGPDGLPLSYYCQLLTVVNDCVTVRLLREELQLLQESGSYVGEVVKAMDKKKVLVKVVFILTSRVRFSVENN